MQGSSGGSFDAAGPSVPAPEVRAQLARILASDGFVSSQRLCRFLRFVVERALESDVERMKEFVVAMEVFDRNEDYDPNVDSIVRVEARRLRTKLKAYYEGPGFRDPVLIGLRPGSYVPLFRPLSPPVSQPAPPPESQAPARTENTVVAVLPFVNMSPEPEQDYFCDGITEEVLNALASIENLVVVARTSAFQFKGRSVDIRDVGARLGAHVVVEGSVRKAGNQLRITAQAIDASKGHHVWSETYRRELQDIFAIQEDISKSIASTLRAKLPARPAQHRAPYQPDLEAYAGYMKAMSLVHQQTIPSLYAAMDQFRELTRRYPDYADPYAGLAGVYAVLSLFGVVSGREVSPELRRNAEVAVRLDPESATGWTVMGGISAHWDFEWIEAEKRFQRAIAVQPSNYGAHSWYGMVLCMLGRFEQSREELTTAARLDPLRAASYTRLATLAHCCGDDVQAMSLTQDSLKLEPSFSDARLIAALVNIHAGDYCNAVELLSRDRDRAPIPLHLGLLAGTLHRAGDVRGCRAILSKLDEAGRSQYVTPLARAFACIGMNDIDGAFEALDAAVADRIIFVDLVNVAPIYDPLRKDQRFTKLIQSLNLGS
jgi:serine/threonine-protein kinase